jgi:polyhydroxybutyrate depolymerase
MKIPLLRNNVVSLFLTLLVSSSILSCGFLEARNEESREIFFQGLNRSYLIYTPPSYNSEKPMPVVLGFHGGTTTAQKFSQTTKFNQLATQEGFIVVYPQGIDKNWNDGRDVAGLPSQDDVAFVSAMIDDIKKIRNIDSHRIYATGISNGGFFTQRLACQLSDKIAAFASVASTLAQPLSTRCNPNNPVSILLINSPDDKFVPWQGEKMTRGLGGYILSVPDTVKFWQQRNSCSFQPDVQSIDNNKKNDGTSIEISRYTQCKSGSEVILTTIYGGGHAWPNGLGQPQWLVGRTSHKIDGSSYIWNFFKRHALP